MKKYIVPELKTLDLNMEQLMAAESVPEVPEDPDFQDLAGEGVFDETTVTGSKSVWDE